MNERKNPSMHTARPRLALVALAVALAGALLLLTAPSAEAGTYRAVQCHDGLGSAHPDVEFRSTSDRYRAAADCDGPGLSITHHAADRPTPGGRYGEWLMSAPAGADIVAASARVAGDGQDWHAPQVAVVRRGGARSTIDGARGSLHAVTWKGEEGRALSARLVCAHADRCGRGENAFLRIRRLAATLRDTTAPDLTLDGPLLEPGSRRGSQGLVVAASDAGGGIRSIVVEVNGDPVASRSFDCRQSQGIAVRMRPCPDAPTARFDVVTTDQFRQGPNQLRVCAADYAQNTDSNRTCTTRTVRIDNRCPVSAVHGAELRARFAGGGTRATVRSDESARVVGRVLDEAGAPVANAQVCVATRPLRRGSTEGYMTTPRTGADGTFAARIPAGPSREIRVAHWPGTDRALERYLTLTSRAVPRLSLRPRRTLRNGERVRFRVSLPGPGAAGKRVEVQARADGRWLRVGRGRTNHRGGWRGAYRFRATTGRRTYAFRAVVVRQRDYPYDGGSSRIAHKTVVGRTAPKTKTG
jgi:hypothetical protein